MRERPVSRCRSPRLAAGLLAGVIALASCGGSDGKAQPTTTGPEAPTTTSGSGDGSTTGDGNTVAAPDDNELLVPGAADALGTGMEGLFVGPDVRVENTSDDPAVRTLRAPFTCDRLRAQLASGNWDVVDRLTSTAQLEAAGIRDTIVFRRNTTIVWATFSGVADCRAVLSLARQTDLVLSLPTGDLSGPGWAVTSRCTDRDAARTVSVELLTADGAGASVNVELDGSSGATVSAAAGRSPLGWLSALGLAYSDPAKPPRGDLFQIDGGSAKVASTDRLRGTVTANAPAMDLNGATGKARLSFPFACTEVEDVSLPTG